MNITGKNLNPSSIGVQTYTNMSYRQKAVKTESRPQRETKGLLRESLREASRVRFKTGFATQTEASHLGNGVPETELWFSKAENSVSLRTWSPCHGPPPPTLWTLEGKVFPCWMERNFTKDQKWRQLETVPGGLRDTESIVDKDRTVIPNPQWETPGDRLGQGAGELQLEQREAKAETGAAMLSALAFFGSGCRSLTKEGGEA